MTLPEAVAALDKVQPVEGTWWGDAIIACREHARKTTDEPDIDAGCNESLDWRYCSGGGMGDCGNCTNANGGEG